MERKVKMRKDTITKEIPENLVSEYMQLGWRKAEKGYKHVERNNRFSVLDKE